MFACGWRTERVVPYLGPENVAEYPYAAVVRHWGETAHLQQHGQRCDTCITLDRLEHPPDPSPSP